MIVVVKEPNKGAGIREIEDKLTARQEIVGGLIEVVSLINGFDLVCNEEFLYMDFEPNILVNGSVVYGTVFITKPDAGGRFVSLTQSESQIAVMILNRMAIDAYRDTGELKPALSVTGRVVY